MEYIFETQNLLLLVNILVKFLHLYYQINVYAACSLQAKPETVEKVCTIVKKQLALSIDTAVNGNSKFAELGADSLDTVFKHLSGCFSFHYLLGRSDVFLMLLLCFV